MNGNHTDAVPTNRILVAAPARECLTDAEHYLLTCMRYIELNPVRADMVEHPADYPYSSYVANAQGKADPLIVPHSIYRRLAKSDVTRQAAYRQLFRAHLSHVDLESIRETCETLHKGWALGNPRFRAKIETLSGRRAAPRLCQKAGQGGKIIVSDPNYPL